MFKNFLVSSLPKDSNNNIVVKIEEVATPKAEDGDVNNDTIIIQELATPKNIAPTVHVKIEPGIEEKDINNNTIIKMEEIPKLSQHLEVKEPPKTEETKVQKPEDGTTPKTEETKMGKYEEIITRKIEQIKTEPLEENIASKPEQIKIAPVEGNIAPTVQVKIEPGLENVVPKPEQVLGPNNVGTTDWKTRAEAAEKRIQKVEMQLVNMKRRAETAESRTEPLSKQVSELESKLNEATSKAQAAQACADLADNLATAAKSQADAAEKRAVLNDTFKDYSTVDMNDPLKAALEKAKTYESKAEAAGKWATDAMEKQAKAEKANKELEERIVSLKAELAIHELPAGARHTGLKGQVLTLREELSKWKLEAKTSQARLAVAETEKMELESECANMRNRALAAESRVQGLIEHLRSRPTANPPNMFRNNNGPGGKKKDKLKNKPAPTFVREGQIKQEKDVEMVTDPLETKKRGHFKKRSADERDSDWNEKDEYVSVPGRRNTGPKTFRCSNCKYTSLDKAEHERHIRKCYIKKPNHEQRNRLAQRYREVSDEYETTADVRPPRTRRTAAGSALETIKEGDQSWQGLMLDNKGIRPGVKVPVDVPDDAAAGFDEKDEEAFLAAEAQELFGDILNSDNIEASGAELQIAEEILNNWEKEIPDEPEHKSKSDKTSNSESQSELDDDDKWRRFDEKYSKCDAEDEPSDNNKISDLENDLPLESPSKTAVAIPLTNRRPSSIERNNNENSSPGKLKKPVGPKSFKLKMAENMNDSSPRSTPSKIPKLSTEEEIIS